ncbi:MAG: DUF2255 family protein [Chloroflexi bacterium]|nr:DUF2255 family protein [Chloroflexota bacterium]
MAEWTSDALTTIGGAEEVRVASLQPDGSLRKPVIIWLVRAGDDLYVRSVNGRGAAWFRGIQNRHEGRIWAGGIEQDVRFVETDDRADEIDASYRAKYRRYPTIVPSIVKHEARAATLRLVPR